MKICYFGTYEKDYPRNRILIKDLIRRGIEVIECHYPVWERQRDKTGTYLSRGSLVRLLFRLIWAYIILIGRFFRAGSFDCLIVGYLGQTDVFVARLLLLFKKKPLIFNPLISLYDTAVLDRELFRKGSLLAGMLYFADKWAFRLSDLIVLDTHENIKYMAELFGIDEGKFARIFVCADKDLFYPGRKMPKEDGSFRVLFYGKFIPLHGIHYILQAAKELEGEPDILFQIIGKGQLSREIHHLADRLNLRNVEFIDWVPYEQLPKHIWKADVCLGIFGDAGKTKRVIPNKVYQALACGKPVITAETPAIRELGKVQCLNLCSYPMEKNLALLISDLKENNHKRTTCLGELNKICAEAFDDFVSKTFYRTDN